MPEKATPTVLPAAAPDAKLASLDGYSPGPPQPSDSNINQEAQHPTGLPYTAAQAPRLPPPSPAQRSASPVLARPPPSAKAPVPPVSNANPRMSPANLVKPAATAAAARPPSAKAPMRPVSNATPRMSPASLVKPAATATAPRPPSTKTTGQQRSQLQQQLLVLQRRVATLEAALAVQKKTQSSPTLPKGQSIKASLGRAPPPKQPPAIASKGAANGAARV